MEVVRDPQGGEACLLGHPCLFDKLVRAVLFARQEAAEFGAPV
jgi:hypothetical protein